MSLTRLLSAVISGSQNNIRNMASPCLERLPVVWNQSHTTAPPVAEHLKGPFSSSFIKTTELCQSARLHARQMQFFAIFMLRSNIQLVECVKKKTRSGQRGNSSSTYVQIQQCRSATYHWSSQRWNYRAAPERLMAQQLLFSLSRIYAWRSGNSIYNHHSYAEDFSFEQLGQRLRKNPFSSSFLWERRRGSCNHHLFTVTHVQIKTERRKRIWDEFHLDWLFLMPVRAILIQHQNQKSAVLACFKYNFT